MSKCKQCNGVKRSCVCEERKSVSGAQLPLSEAVRLEPEFAANRIGLLESENAALTAEITTLRAKLAEAVTVGEAADVVDKVLRKQPRDIYSAIWFDATMRSIRKALAAYCREREARNG